MTKGILMVGMSLLLALAFATTTVPEAVAPGAALTEEQTEQVPEKRYYLTADERELICEVVMAESGTELYAGKIAVSQCVLNACEKTGKRPADIVTECGYTAHRVKPSAEVEKAVSAVFDDGVTVTPLSAPAIITACKFVIKTISETPAIASRELDRLFGHKEK